MSDNRSLDDWLAKLERQHPVSIDLGLERVTDVATRMGLQRSPIAKRVISVAGTNGKGSTVAILEALALAHGLTTATYTSPHLLSFNERLHLDGFEATDAVWISAFERVEEARLTPQPISLSYFEVATLAALWVIAGRCPELAILEVGLGGRLDAVNVIDADVAVITTVAQDHAAFLGTDLDQIGREKAGIMRAARPVILGSASLPGSVRRHALALGAGIHQLASDFHREGPADAWRWTGRDGHGNTTTLEALGDPHLPLDNAATALQALAMCDIPLEVEACRQGLGNVSLPGRLQWWGRWCLDVAHNPHAAEYLTARLAERPRPARRIGLLGMLADKDADGVIAALCSQIDAWVTVSLAGERSREATELSALLVSHQQDVLHCAASPQLGAEWLLSEMGAHDEVLVCGSFFTVAEVLGWLAERPRSDLEPPRTARRKS